MACGKTTYGAVLALSLTLMTAGVAWAGEGALAVTTEPRDAEVLVDGKLVASQTPVVLRLPEGAHRVEIQKKEYYGQNINVIIPVDGVISHKIALKRWPQLWIASKPTGATISLNGAPVVGNTPIRMNLAAGTYRIEAHRAIDDYDEYYGLKEVTISNESTQSVSVIMSERLTEKGKERERRRVQERAFAEQARVQAEQERRRLEQERRRIERERLLSLQKVELERLRSLTLPEMVIIPPGSFIMGSTNGEGDERPTHRVNIGYWFELSATPITFDQWDACLADGGCDGYRPRDSSWGRGARPVIHISWNDAQKYIQWLNRKTGKIFRLPSEAEWEYAARAGTTTKYWWGDEVGRNNANCDGCGSQWDNKLAPVASFRANSFGVYDMLGNVFQWVEDCQHDSYVGAPINGRAWTQDCRDTRRIQRGGGWYRSPDVMRSAFRRGHSPEDQFDDYGFRIAKTINLNDLPRE